MPCEHGNTGVDGCPDGCYSYERHRVPWSSDDKPDPAIASVVRGDMPTAEKPNKEPLKGTCFTADCPATETRIYEIGRRRVVLCEPCRISFVEKAIAETDSELAEMNRDDTLYGSAGDILLPQISTEKPIPMRIPCPECRELHVDEGEFATKPHHTHACQFCGLVWRPAIVPTVGVRFLPGYKSGGDS